MSEDETRQGSIVMSFTRDPRTGAFMPSSGYAEKPGISSLVFSLGFLQVLEEVFVQDMSELEGVLEVLSYKHVWRWADPDDGPTELPDEEKQQLVRLLANRVLVDQVVSRKYAKGVDTAALSVPMFD